MPEKFFGSARKIFRQGSKKTATLTCKITLPDSPHPVIVGKNPGFRALYLAGRNEFGFFRLINTFFSFLAAGFCPKNLAFARKILNCPSHGGAAAPPAPLARTPMSIMPIADRIG